jgi:uncharacterized protein (TIGR02145 family)
MRLTLLVLTLFFAISIFAQEKTRKIDFDLNIRDIEFVGDYDGSITKSTVNDKKRNVPQGEGIFIGKNGLNEKTDQWVYYNGLWVNGQMEGIGTFCLLTYMKGVKPNWDFIIEMINSKSPNLMKFADEFVTGEFRQNSPFKQCSYVSQKYKYEGDMIDWRCHGNGKKISKDTFLLINHNFVSVVSEGTFENDQLIDGTLKFATGEQLKGNWKNKQFTGEGQIPSFEDAVYLNSKPYCINNFTGQFENGDFAQGKMELCNGNILEGEWKNKIYTGQGKLNVGKDSVFISSKLLFARTFDGKFYLGEFTEGKMEFENNEPLIGHWSKKRFTGTAKIEKLNEKIIISELDYPVYEFEGKFKDGEYLDGELTLISGDKFNGTWSNKLFSGITKLSVRNESIKIASGLYTINLFEGRINQNEYAEGKMILSNGDSLIGTWSNKLFSGITKLSVRNDSIKIASSLYSITQFEGRINQSEYAEGNMILNSCDKLSGIWTNNIFTGKAKLKTSNYSTYLSSKPYLVAEFNGQITKSEFSEGKMILSNGDSLIGTWNNNLFTGFGHVRNNDRIELASIPFEMNEFKGQFINGNYDNGQLVLNRDGILSGTLKDKKFSGNGRVQLNDIYGYEGEWVDGSANGKGTLTKRNEFDFIGNFAKNEITGEGKKTLTNGTIFKGQWQGTIDKGNVSVQVIGEYSITSPNGLVCIGVNEGNRFKGKGEIELNDKSIYNGTLTIESSKIIEGSGKITFPGGDVLIVNWDNDGYTGIGRRNFGVNNEGDSLYEEGTFRNGLLYGQGKKLFMFELRNDQGDEDTYYSSYEGEFKNGSMHGKGKLKCVTPGIEHLFEGDWSTNNILTGTVYSLFGNAYEQTYTGGFSNFKPTGNGKLVTNKEIYIGSFVNGFPNGIGKIIYEDGSTYEGEVSMGIASGKGIKTLKNKQTLSGNFENGEYQKPYTCKEERIGDQIWMAENLTVTKFRNGDPIPEARSIEEWVNAGENKEPAFCYVNNDPNTVNQYGVLYNWYAVVDRRGLAPEGWHIPNHTEAENLRNFLMSDIITKQQKITNLENDGINTDNLQSELNKIFRTCRHALNCDFKFLPSYEKGAKYFLRKTDRYYREYDGDFVNDYSENTYGPGPEEGSRFWTSSIVGDDGYNMFFSEIGCLNSGDNCDLSNGYWSDSWLVLYKSQSSDKKEGYNVRCIKN